MNVHLLGPVLVMQSMRWITFMKT